MTQELFSKLRALRHQLAHGVIRPDGKELARQLCAAGMTLPSGDIEDFVANFLRVFGSLGQHQVPTLVLDTVRLILDGRKANVTFDPWAGLGVLAATVRDATNPAKSIACSQDSGDVVIGKALCPQLDWRVSEPLAAIESLSGSIDVIASTLPFGMRSQRRVELTTPTGVKLEIGGDWGQVLLAAASQHLASDGIGLFVVTPNLFFAHNSVFLELPKLGLGVEAALALPAGSYAPYTNIPAFLVMVRRKLFDRMFVAELSHDAATNRQIIANLRQGRADGELEMGRLVDGSAFRGLDSIRAAEQLEKVQLRFAAPVVRLGDLATSIELGRPNTDFEFTSFENRVFIPLVGITDVVTSLDQTTLKHQNYAQVAIDPTRSDARFVAQFLNSELGRSIRNAGKSGSTIQKLNTTGLHELAVVVPKLAIQRNILEIAMRLTSEQNTVLGLQSELASLRRDLWSDPQNRDQVDQSVRILSARLASGATSHAAATLDQWFESLPFPLASILRAWQATQSQDYKAKQEHLLHFFEASAEFLAVICLSAFGSREEIYAEHREKLSDAWAKQNMTLQRATFGLWKVAVEYLAKQTRTLLSGEEDDKAMCRELFGDPTLSLPRMIARKELVEVLSATNKMRNDWTGHGGVVSQEEAQLRNQVLVTELHKMREAMADGWAGVHLVRASHCQSRRGVFETEIALMTGSNSEFLKECRTMSCCLDVERLYLASRESGRPLQLLPFLNVGPSPASAKNACYFFNRVEKDGVRFVSYHFVDQPERREQADDTSAAIRFLSRGQP